MTSFADIVSHPDLSKKQSHIYEDILRLSRQTTKAGWLPDKEDNADRRKIDRKDGSVFS
ncbi:MAG: hypothetical protein FWF88_05150 [Peptococcaceae bacterium]|nr:hypothetical protein [Peptococcaceae bacterium]